MQGLSSKWSYHCRTPFCKETFSVWERLFEWQHENLAQYQLSCKCSQPNWMIAQRWRHQRQTASIVKKKITNWLFLTAVFLNLGSANSLLNSLKNEAFVIQSLSIRGLDYSRTRKHGETTNNKGKTTVKVF